MARRIEHGSAVTIPWGSGEVRGTVAEVYGPDHYRQVVVRLTPEESGHVVDEPTTFVFPLTQVKAVAAADA